MHWHVDTVVTLLTNAMVVDIIKPTDPTFPNVPQHICSLERYWPHFKILCKFGILTWFYLIYLYGYNTYRISHGIFMAMIRIALVRLMGFTSLRSHQLMSKCRTDNTCLPGATWAQEVITQDQREVPVGGHQGNSVGITWNLAGWKEMTFWSRFIVMIVTKI